MSCHTQRLRVTGVNVEVNISGMHLGYRCKWTRREWIRFDMNENVIEFREIPRCVFKIIPPKKREKFGASPHALKECNGPDKWDPWSISSHQSTICLLVFTYKSKRMFTLHCLRKDRHRLFVPKCLNTLLYTDCKIVSKGRRWVCVFSSASHWTHRGATFSVFSFYLFPHYTSLSIQPLALWKPSQ